MLKFSYNSERDNDTKDEKYNATNKIISEGGSG